MSDAENTESRDILNVLKYELHFLEHGGYARYVRAPWRATSIFQDSPSCINFKTTGVPYPCTECMLYPLVPPSARGEEIPCHHIPLNTHGETVHSMERQRTQLELENEVREWLRATIARLENEHGGERADAAA